MSQYWAGRALTVVPPTAKVTCGGSLPHPAVNRITATAQPASRRRGTESAYGRVEVRNSPCRGAQLAAWERRTRRVGTQNSRAEVRRSPCRNAQIAVSNAQLAGWDAELAGPDAELGGPNAQLAVSECATRVGRRRG